MSEQTRDEIIEEIALAVEEGSLLDIRGIWAKRKRAREDAELRMKAREEQRNELGRFIRSYKSHNGNDPMMVLESIAENEDMEHRHNHDLIHAWPLAWKGWVTIECVIQCNSNCIPPPTRFQIRLTEEGREVLATSDVKGRETR